MKFEIISGGHLRKYGVEFEKRIPLEVQEWCHQRFDFDYERVYVGRWYVAFKNEADRSLFLLRWG